MPESMVKGLVGTHTHDQGDKKFNDARETAQPRYCQFMQLDGIGAVVIAGMYLYQPRTKIRVLKFYAMNAGADITAGANKPEFGLFKGNTAAGALTEITLDATSRIHYDTGGTHAARTQRAAILKTDGTEVIDGAAGDAIYVGVDVNGTPADMGADTYVTWVVEYVLEN